MKKPSLLLKWLTGLNLIGLFILLSAYPLQASAAPFLAPGGNNQYREGAPAPILTEIDLPGFREANESEVVGYLALARRLTSGIAGFPGEITNISFFSNRNPFRTEYVINFVVAPLAENDILRFNALTTNPRSILDSLQEIAQASGHATEPHRLDELNDLGNVSMGFTLTVGQEPVSQSIAFSWVRRGGILQSTWVIYPVREAPSISIHPLALLVDQRVQEIYPDYLLGTTFRTPGLVVPSLTTHIPTPLEISTRQEVIVANLVLAALMMLPFATAAELFTRMLAEREKSLQARVHPPKFFSRINRLARDWLNSISKKRSTLASILRFCTIMFFYGVTFSLLDRNWYPFSVTGLILFLDMTVAYGIVGIAGDILRWRTLRKWGTPAELSLRPTNIFLSIASTITSRLLALVPGLMFGTPQALVADESQLDEVKRNQLLEISATGLMAIGFGLWCVTALTDLIQRGPLSEPLSLLVGGLEAFLLIVSAVALENTFVQMLGFPGGFGVAIRKRNRWMWLLGLIAITFMFLHTLINPRGELTEALQQSNVWLLLGVSGTFVLFTFSWWGITRIKGKKEVKIQSQEKITDPVKTKPTSLVKQRIPLRVWLASIVVVLLGVSLLVVPRGEVQKNQVVSTPGLVENQTTPTPLVTPAAGSIHPSAPDFQPPSLLKRLCYVPSAQESRALESEARIGLQLVAALYGAWVIQVDPEVLTDTPNDQAVDRLIQLDCDLIVGLMPMTPALQVAAVKHPDQKFWSVGGNDLPNVWVTDYNVHQSAYLAAYLAAAISATKVSTFGGVTYPGTVPYMDCMLQSVSDYNQAHQAKAGVLAWETHARQGAYIFTSPEKQLSMTDQLRAWGAKIILPGTSVEISPEAAGEDGSIRRLAGAKVIGVDLFDEEHTPSPDFTDKVVAIVENRVDKSLAIAIGALVNGKFTGGKHTGTLATGEIHFSPLRSFFNQASPDTTEELAQLAVSTTFEKCQRYEGTFNPTNGHWYRLFNGQLDFNSAQSYCAGQGAHLVTIADAAENQFVYHISPSTLMGATDVANEGQWEWVTGEPWSYTNWPPGEPNNCSGDGCSPEHYLYFHYELDSGEWNDLAMKSEFIEFLCEWDQ